MVHHIPIIIWKHEKTFSRNDISSNKYSVIVFTVYESLRTNSATSVQNYMKSMNNTSQNVFLFQERSIQVFRSI